MPFSIADFTATGFAHRIFYDIAAKTAQQTLAQAPTRFSGSHLKTVIVEIHVTLDAGKGRTDSKVDFHAAKAHATIRLGRSTIERAGRGFARSDEIEAKALALSDLVERVVDSIAF